MSPARRDNARPRGEHRNDGREHDQRGSRQRDHPRATLDRTPSAVRDARPTQSEVALQPNGQCPIPPRHRWQLRPSAIRVKHLHSQPGPNLLRHAPIHASSGTTPLASHRTRHDDHDLCTIPAIDYRYKFGGASGGHPWTDDFYDIRAVLRAHRSEWHPHWAGHLVRSRAPYGMVLPREPAGARDRDNSHDMPGGPHAVAVPRQARRLDGLQLALDRERPLSQHGLHSLRLVQVRGQRWR